jgi:membrane-anchored protein YejM (alkaline phosphatase superfamily)
MPLAQEAAGGFRTNGPHLLFIVIESLRGDMLDHETAPHLWALRQEAVRSADAVSASDA